MPTEVISSDISNSDFEKVSSIGVLVIAAEQDYNLILTPTAVTVYSFSVSNV
jgi:hypothetical protein